MSPRHGQREPPKEVGRAFVAVRPPDDVLDAVAAGVAAGAAAVGEQVAFPVLLGGAGAFPTARRARVVWIGAAAGGDALVGLAGAVSAALRPVGFEPDRPLHPHLTVARLKVPGDAGPVLTALGPDAVGPAFTVGEVVLYASRLSAAGPTYTPLERFPLRNA